MACWCVPEFCLECAACAEHCSCKRTITIIAEDVGDAFL